MFSALSTEVLCQLIFSFCAGKTHVITGGLTSESVLSSVSEVSVVTYSVVLDRPTMVIYISINTNICIYLYLKHSLFIRLIQIKSGGD